MLPDIRISSKIMARSYQYISVQKIFNSIASTNTLIINKYEAVLVVQI